MYDSGLLLGGLTRFANKATVQQPGKSRDLRIDEMCKGEGFFRRFETCDMSECSWVKCGPQIVHGSKWLLGRCSLMRL